MKKTILLASLVATVAMAAGTTGTVKGFYEGKGTFDTKVTLDNEGKKVKTTDKSYGIGKVGVETEVKVEGTGLSFGGTFQGKDIVLPLSKYTGKVKVNNDDKEGEKCLVDTFFNNSNIFVKYELPEMHKVNSYVKATLNPKVNDRVKHDDVDKELSFKAGNVELEADVNYEVLKDVKVGLNSKTTFPFENPKDNKAFIKESADKTKWEKDQLNYGSKVVSTHKLYVKAFEDEKNEKGFKFRNLNANIELQHTYTKSENVKKEGELADGATELVKAEAKSVNKFFKYVALAADGTYAVNKELDLSGKFRFKYQVNGEINYKGQYLGDKDLLEGIAGFEKEISFPDDVYKIPFNYVHAYSLEGVYKGIKDTELKANGFINHGHIGEADANHDLVNYGVILNGKYTGVKNLTLSGKATLSGISVINKEKDKKVDSKHFGLFDFGAGAKYDYKVTDKFTVSPEANIDVMVLTAKVKDPTDDSKTVQVAVAGITLAPKVSAEYKPIDKLTITGSVEVPISFAPVANYKLKENQTDKYEKDTKKPYKLGYKSTSIKTALNVEYKW